MGVEDGYQERLQLGFDLLGWLDTDRVGKGMGDGKTAVNLQQTSNTHQDQVNCGASVLVWWSFNGTKGFVCPECGTATGIWCSLSPSSLLPGFSLKRWGSRSLPRAKKRPSPALTRAICNEGMGMLGK